MRASNWLSLGLMPCLLLACRKPNEAPQPDAAPIPAIAPAAADAAPKAPEPPQPPAPTTADAAPTAAESAATTADAAPNAPPSPPAAPVSRAAQLADLARAAAEGTDEIRDVAAFLREHVPAVFEDGLERTFPPQARIRAMLLENEGTVIGALVQLASPDYLTCQNNTLLSIFGLLLDRDTETGEEYITAGSDQQTRVFDGADVKLEFPADFATARSFGITYRYDGDKDCPSFSAPPGLYMDILTVSSGSLEVLDTVELDVQRDDRGRLVVDRAKVEWLAGASGPLIVVRAFRSETLSEEAGGEPGGSLSCRLTTIVYVLDAELQWAGMEGDQLAGLQADEPGLRRLPDAVEGDTPARCDALQRKLD
jgi:hypothetical protein